MRDCIKRIMEISKNTIDAVMAKEILETIDREAKRQVTAGFDYDEAVKKVTAEKVQNTKDNIARQKAAIARNVLLKASNGDKISRLIDAGLSIKEAFVADLEGISSHIEGTRDSLDMQKSAVEHSYFSRMLGELNREGLLPVLNSKALNDEIGKELWALSNKEKGATQNKQAARIAEIIFKTRDGQRLRLNNAGADISEVGGYVMPQRHDTYAMHSAGEDAWVTFMAPLLDPKRTFGGDYVNFEQALRQAFRAMVTGIRLNDPLDYNPKLFQFSGPANLGKKLSQARQLHFKDYTAWKQWNEAYGSKDLNEGVIDAVRFDAHNIALMERYGTNPEAMMNALATDAKRKYRDKAASEGELGIDGKISSVIDAAMQKNMLPVNPALAQVGSNIRAYQNVTKLGGAVISSITDIPMKALEYKFQGKTWLGATVQPWLDLANGFKSKQERIEWASLTGVGFESIVADIGSRFSVQDNLSNKAAKVQRIYFKMNGLAWWTDTHKNAMGRVMAHHLGLKRDMAFDTLDADTRRLFGNYNITAKDWDTIRASAKELGDGRHYVLAEFIPNEKLREKLIGYFVDRTDFGVITPGTKENRITTFGTQRGTPIGEAARLIMQFKSFPVTAITKVWGRALYGKGKADLPAIAYLMLNTMAFGYAAGALKDMLKGKSPKDPEKLETAYAALAQGGGLGILGDILLNDSSGFGRSATQTLAGPTFGTIDDIAKMYSAGMRGGGSKRQAAMTGINAIPFNNLFYTRAALDQMLLLQMQEDMNPGYLRRMERNMKKTYGQELLYK